MKKAFVIFIVLLIAGIAHAQTEDWLWAKSAGGTSYETNYGIAVDGIGNSYVTGSFSGIATFGNTSLTSFGGNDIYIAKLDANGNFLWAVKAGGASHDSGYGIAVDASGNSYVAGNIYGTAAFGGTSLVSGTYGSIFVTKLDTNGNFLWAIQAGGTDSIEAYGIAVDGSGNSYVVGNFSGTATFGGTSLPNHGSYTYDIFITKLDTNGNFQWAKGAGGADTDLGNGIGVDIIGNIFVTGAFQGTATFGSTSLTSSGSNDIFIAKLDPNGNSLWVRRAGGPENDIGSAIAVDGDGNSYMTGPFHGTATFGSTALTGSGSDELFVTKLDANGNFLWADKAGGSIYFGSGIAVDGSGSSYVTGYFQGTATFGSTSLTSSGANDIFITKLDTNGNILWAYDAGGTSLDYGSAIAVDGGGNSYVAGHFLDATTIGGISMPSSGAFDLFISKFGWDTRVLAPNGGENWQTGSAMILYWDFHVPDSFVNIYLSINNGTSWIMLSSSPVSTALGRYSFTVPSVNSNQCLIKVQSTSNPAPYDASDAPFTISSSVSESLTVLGPAYSILQAGNTYPINLTATGVSTVNLDYSCNAGGSWIGIATNIPASYGSYAWTVPNTPSGTCYLRATSSSNPAVYDWTDNPFTIGSLQLLSPNGGEIWEQLTEKTISWSSDHVTNVRLDYSIDNGVTWIPIISGLAASDNSYDWVLPEVNSTQCRVRISDADFLHVHDTCDQPFNIRPLIIVTSPNGGEYLAVYSIYSIQWSSLAGVSQVVLDYSIDGGSTWLVVQSTPVAASTGSYDWIVPDNPSTNCRVRVSSSANSAICDVSDAAFTITIESDLPKPPQGVSIVQDGENMVISWEAVTETMLGLPFVPDYYLVFYNGSSDPDGIFYFLGASSSLSYTHYLEGTHAQYMFYRVLAYKHYGRSPFDINSLQTGMPEREVLQLLDHRIEN